MTRSLWKYVLRVAALGVASAGVAAQGQTPVPVRIGFDQAIARAIERNPTVAQAATAIARADVLLQQARYALMPIAVMRVSNVTLDDARGFSEGITQPQNQFFFAPNVIVPLLAQRQRSAVGQARDQIEVATRSTAEVRQRVAVAAAQAYLGVIAARRQREVDERSLEAARAHLEHARRRLEGGVGSRLNEVRAAQAVAAAEARTEGARLGLRRAQEALGVLLAEDGPVDADAEPSFDIPGSVDEAEWSAARPDLQFEAAVRRAADRVIRDSWKDWMPAATASFDPLLLTPAGLFQPARTWRLTLSVTQPLFQGGQRKSLEARLAEVAVSQSKLTESLLRIQARSEIRMAQESVASLARAQVNARQAAEHANEVLRITMTAFEVGATTNIEVIDAQRSARDAETVATLAEDAVRRARLDLLVGLGRFPK